jgi:hypothetical protein
MQLSDFPFGVVVTYSGYTQILQRCTDVKGTNDFNSKYTSNRVNRDKLFRMLLIRNRLIRVLDNMFRLYIDFLIIML